MTRRYLTTAAVLAVLTVTGTAGCGGGSTTDTPAPPAPSPSSSRTPLPLLVRGMFTLELPAFVWEGTVCTGRDAHDDITAGTKVVVTDNTGAIVGVGVLDAGQPQMNPDDKTRADSCLFQFTVKDVPSGRGFYSVEVSSRGKVEFKETALHDYIQIGLT
ncbi:hypothetical protein JNW88_08275 [Micromonospora sp. ATA32]|nr:hypothetical protein [Micromonospora sp. ATA32]